MKSTFILKLSILFIGAVVLALCGLILPEAIASDRVGAYRPILFGMYVSAVPFFIALYNGFTLLGNIDKNKAFSGSSIRALTTIKSCAAIISAAYTLGLPYIYYVADMDDAPGVLALGLVITFASGVIATFAAVLQKLLQSAADIKSENDLTV